MIRLIAAGWLLAASLVPGQPIPVIATVAGSTGPGGAPNPGYGGDGGPARRALLALAGLRGECDPAQFEQISHLALDSQGNLYVADSANHRIRRVTPAGRISTIAGTGERPPIDPRTCVPTGGPAALGEGGAAAAARLYNPAGVAIHPNGNLVIADQQSNRVRMVVASGAITTIAGNGLHAFYAPGVPATSSGLDWPTAVAVSSSGEVYFSELHSGRVARIAADGRLVTVAGTGIPGFSGDSGAATSVRLRNPAGIALDASGNLYIADQGNHRVRKVSPAGMLTTIFGAGAGQLDRPADVKVDGAGNVYVSDMGNHRVLRISAAGEVAIIAGDGVARVGPDGVPATASSMAFPTGLAVDPAGSDVFVVDWNNYLIRRLSFRPRPVITSGGIRNAAGFAMGALAPGSLFTIFGVNLAASTQQAGGAPWPLELGSASVWVNGEAAPLHFVSPGQINAQVPYSAASSELSVTVTTSQDNSPPEYVQAAAAAIGVFADPVTRHAIALNQDGTLNGPDNAESAGRVLTVFLTGIGTVRPEIETGAAAASVSLHHAGAGVSATLGGAEARIQFLGLTPGFVGLGQCNLQILEGTPAGDVALVFQSGGHRSNAALVSVR